MSFDSIGRAVPGLANTQLPPTRPLGLEAHKIAAAFGQMQAALSRLGRVVKRCVERRGFGNRIGEAAAGGDDARTLG